MKSYGLSFGNSRIVANSLLPLFIFLISSVVLIPSFIDTTTFVVTELDFMFANMFYGLYEPTYQMGGVYDI